MLGTYVIYNSILLFSTLFVWLYEKSKNKNIKTVSITVAFLIVFLPAAIRYNIGSDYWSYINIYELVKAGENTDHEIGFVLILKVLAFFEMPGHAFIVFTSFVIYLFLFLSYPKKGAAVYHFMYMVMFYLVSYNLIRTAVVLSLCLFLIKLIINKKTLFSKAMVFFIACSVHKSAVLILIPLLLMKINIGEVLKNRVYAILTILLFVTLFFLRDMVVNLFVASGIADILGYGHYINSGYFTSTEINTGVGLLIKAAILFGGIYYLKEFDKTYRNVAAASILMLVVAYILQSAIEIFTRVQRFYIFGFIFAGIGFYSAIDFTIKKIIIWFLFLTGVLFFETDIHRMKSDICSGSRISPYVSIFDKHNDHSWSGIHHGECLEW